jgi:hypothetical protein
VSDGRRIRRPAPLLKKDAESLCFAGGPPPYAGGLPDDTWQNFSIGWYKSRLLTY